ncbi:DUF262 domain-containing protein [Ornithinimicrobium sp. LYQ121]|uniref:DUF262 domain-containing protein n=1 Tax=Ornithinimicrobium sp. LYQ121 TaxID=3378801 RepID=UPI003854CBC6
MGYLPEITVADAIRRIQKGDLVLPAIQREYVWKPGQVMGIFDSLMRGYPVGGFLSWRVEPETAAQFRFYGFMKDFNALDNRHNPDADPMAGQSVTAVLDGQQRLTSFNIGLRGTYAYKLPRAWSNLASSYPVRRLYLNVLGEAEDNEAGLMYDFRFLTDVQLTAAVADPERHWFPVQRVFEAEKMSQLWAVTAQAGLANHDKAVEILSQLWESIHTTTNVKFFEETEQDIDRVLDIFIRVNSAGTVLSYSDLLLSIATAQWKERDARAAIHGLVDELNSTGAGFNFSQDIVLKSGLVLAGVSDVGFKVKNFTTDTMATLDREWDAIADSLKTAAGLLADFGLSTATLSANSVLIPIAFYVHHRGLGQKYRAAVADTADREALRQWTLRSLIVPGVWGAGLDTLLRDLRQTIMDHGSQKFPSLDIERRMAQRGKSLALTAEQVEEILSLRYGKPRTFAVLAVLFPHVNTRNVHHVDHVYPQALLSTKELKAAGLDSERVSRLQGLRDLLPNLQLLEMSVNISKSASPPAAWAESSYPSQELRQAYLERNEIPWLPASPDEFDTFFAERRAALAQRIMRLLGAESSATGDISEQVADVAGTIDDELAVSDDDL